MNTTKQVLIKARNKIKNGWCRNACHKRIRGNDHYCATGAVIASTESPQQRQAAYAVLAKSLLGNPWPYSESASQVIDFNDEPTRAKAHVIALFNRAIKSL